MRTRLAFATIVITWWLYTAYAAAQEKRLPLTLKPLVALSGTDSHVGKPSYERVTSSDEWARVWSRHLGTSVNDAYRAIMDIDFNRCLAIAVFRGEQTQVRQVTIESVSESSGAISVRFWELTYGIMRSSNENPPKPERPYAFIVLPKTNKEIVLEEKVWSKEDAARGRPPNWREVARLKPAQTPFTKQSRSHESSLAQWPAS